MKEEMARAEFPNWANSAVRIVDEDDGPVLVRQWKHEQPGQRRRIDWERLVKRYGIVVAGAALFTLYTIVLSWCVHAGAVKQVRADMEIEYAARLEEYKAEQARAVQAEYFMSGDASREAAINQDAMELSKDSGVWKNENAFKCYCWNVVVRKMSPLYPASIQSCLSQDGQYDFYDTNGVYTEEKFEWAKSVLEQAESGKLPSFLTVGHLYLEMKDGGADCVLHTSFEKNGADDPWRYRG